MEQLIRRMQMEDIAEVLEIQNSLGFQDWSEQSFRSEVSNTDYSIPLIFKNDRILGYMVTRIVADEAELCSIAVRKENEGKGVAHRLLATCDSILDARSIRQMFLEVRISNSRAIQFYHRNGFQDMGLRKKYYQDGEDALLMSRRLPAHA